MTTLTAAATAARENTVYKPPNPMDPLDPFKRWYRELWPAQRVGVWLCLALVVWALLLWVTI